jgi:pimeloyl-ACP methyl ester carboxylesterase
MKSANFNRGDPIDQMEHLINFRANHPCKYMDVGSIHWEYIVSGIGTEILLVLPGGLRIAEHAFGYIELFESIYRVITPTYPHLNSIDEVTDGVIAILDAESAQSVYVLGQSAGGVVAQVLVQRFPSRVKKLILSSTSPLKMPKWKTAFLWICNTVIPLLPKEMATNLYKNMIGQVMDIPKIQMAFWETYLSELFSKRLTKADVISHFRTGKDAIQKYGYDKPGVEAWSSEVLILGGEKDPVSTESDRKVMAAFYPHSKVYVIQGTGHTPAISEPDKYAEIVNHFLIG